MPKKIRFESFVYRFLVEANAVERRLAPPHQALWRQFIQHISFRYQQGKAVVSWNGANPGTSAFPLAEADFYHRGDTERCITEQRESNLLGGDLVQQKNADYFRDIVMDVCKYAGMDLLVQPAAGYGAEGRRLASEQSFHDHWATSEDASAIDVLAMYEACTSPEMRYIRTKLGDLNGKKVLDVGCGLGEASIYFALSGADVTSMDISEAMLAATSRLAARYGVTVQTHKAAVEHTDLPTDRRFDVIYAGNLLHHVDIEATLGLLKPHLSANGVFVSWDPIAYNPIINIYRSIATTVRTPDEHPLKWKDIRLLQRQFGEVTTKYFWFTTLIIFVLMVAVQRRNPNKERFWKAVVRESRSWEWIYRPLKKLDDFLLAILPPLRLLCWNVVIVAKNPV